VINGFHAIVYTRDADADRRFFADVSDEGFGLLTALRLPGGGELGLYEPRHPSPLFP
jgi:hypothetical protein